MYAPLLHAIRARRRSSSFGSQRIELPIHEQPLPIHEQPLVSEMLLHDEPRGLSQANLDAYSDVKPVLDSTLLLSTCTTITIADSHDVVLDGPESPSRLPAIRRLVSVGTRKVGVWLLCFVSCSWKQYWQLYFCPCLRFFTRLLQNLLVFFFSAWRFLDPTELPRRLGNQWNQLFQKNRFWLDWVLKVQLYQRHVVIQSTQFLEIFPVVCRYCDSVGGVHNLKSFLILDYLFPTEQQLETPLKYTHEPCVEIMPGIFCSRGLIHPL